MTELPKPYVQPGRGNLPVVLSIPHSGREYPDWLVRLAYAGRAALEPLEDPLVDRLAWRAMQLGVWTVIARAPRAGVDCNRAEDEVDPAAVEGRWPGPISNRARGGLGIVPSRTQQHGTLWRRPISRAELNRRLEDAHRPFHMALEAGLRESVARFGTALLLDCHSMPPPARGTPPIIFGNRHGRTAPPWLCSEAARIVEASGYRAAFNDPFAGGHIVERHAAPHRGVYALQVEFDRSLYLDASFQQAGAGFDAVTTILEDLVSGLGALLSRDPIATAAE